MKDFLKMVWERFNQLIAKIISIKFLVWGVGTVALFLGFLDPWVWLTLSASVISIRSFEKALDAGNKYDNPFGGGK